MKEVERTERNAGFTLVEVSLAMGILAFCLISLLSLLPVAMGSFRDAAREADATMVLRQFSSALISSIEVGDGVYALPDAGSIGGISWTAGGSVNTVTGYVAASGARVTTPQEAVLVWSLQITPPASQWTRGKALLRIAWPATATYGADGWENAQGEMRSLIFFRP